jgi:hypothetical protein
MLKGCPLYDVLKEIKFQWAFFNRWLSKSIYLQLEETLTVQRQVNKELHYVLDTVYSLPSISLHNSNFFSSGTQTSKGYRHTCYKSSKGVKDATRDNRS